MSDWDRNSPELDANCARILAYAYEDARSRSPPTSADALKWHSDLMHGLEIPPDECGGFEPENLVGRFRGMPGLETCIVRIGAYLGVAPDRVAEQLEAFDRDLQSRVELLDAQIGFELSERHLTAAQIIEILKLCAWVHAEWIRIHPFANGNGRTARIWANYIAMRYALSPFVRIRPRPGADYAAAGAAAMEGYWEKSFLVFLRMYEDYEA